MLHKPSISSQASSEYDFDCGVGELLEYDETAMSCAVIDGGSFAADGDEGDRDHRYLLSLSPVHESMMSHADRTSPASDTSSPVDQYHPDNAKRELLEYVLGSSDGRGQIPVTLLRHSSEQWSNYADLCQSLELQLRRDGYPNAVVDTVVDDMGRRILYSLRR
ncbi:hypothetical protein PYCC9005_000407 [Savitreella phatthalungensis]